MENVTVNTGRGNAGAVGLQFYSNNSGAVRSVTIVAEDGQGSRRAGFGPPRHEWAAVGANLRPRDLPWGCSRGTSSTARRFVNFLTLSGQTNSVGFNNGGQCVGRARTVVKRGAVSTGNKNDGLMALLEAKLIG